MKVYRTFNKKVKNVLRNGGVAVIPTDTIYGIVGSALQPKTVERIYSLKQRNKKKPMIILIGSVNDFKKFGIILDSGMKTYLKTVWPGPVSVILSISSKKFAYLHRGTKSLAFRLPAEKFLRVFLKGVGPIVAPSANIESKPPVKSIAEARKQFGSRVDCCVDRGRLAGKPSKLVSILKGTVRVLRI